MSDNLSHHGSYSVMFPPKIPVTGIEPAQIFQELVKKYPERVEGHRIPLSRYINRVVPTYQVNSNTGNNNQIQRKLTIRKLPSQYQPPYTTQP